MWWALISASFLAFYLSIFQACKNAPADQIKLYLASSLTPLAKDLMAMEPKLSLTFLSSSAIARQIEHGAPCDSAVLADTSFARQLLLAQHAKPAQILLRNSLVLAIHDRSIKTLAEAFERLAPQDKIIIADPSYVPLGLYTKEALEKLGLYQQAANHLLLAHSASHARLLYETKVASYAFLYRTDAINTYAIALDTALHRPIEYPWMICKNANPLHVKKLTNLFLSDGFRKLLKDKGFNPIDL